MKKEVPLQFKTVAFYDSGAQKVVNLNEDYSKTFFNTIFLRKKSVKKALFEEQIS